MGFRTQGTNRRQAKTRCHLSSLSLAHSFSRRGWRGALNNRQLIIFGVTAFSPYRLFKVAR